MTIMTRQPTLFEVPVIESSDRLYVAVPDAHPTLLKIGTTSRSLLTRERELHARIVWSAPGGRVAERILHERFADARLVGTEYFMLTPEIARYFGLCLLRTRR
jgi:hypothetical protein